MNNKVGEGFFFTIYFHEYSLSKCLRKNYSSFAIFAIFLLISNVAMFHVKMNTFLMLILMLIRLMLLVDSKKLEFCPVKFKG